MISVCLYFWILWYKTYWTLTIYSEENIIHKFQVTQGHFTMQIKTKQDHKDTKPAKHIKKNEIKKKEANSQYTH